MKKCFVLSMVLSMLLCGCSFENTPETDATDAAATTEAAQDTTAAEPTTEKATEAPQKPRQNRSVPGRRFMQK